jgi:hypothetical protein
LYDDQIAAVEIESKGEERRHEPENPYEAPPRAADRTASFGPPLLAAGERRHDIGHPLPGDDADTAVAVVDDDALTADDADQGPDQDPASADATPASGGRGSSRWGPDGGDDGSGGDDGDSEQEGDDDDRLTDAEVEREMEEVAAAVVKIVEERYQFFEDHLVANTEAWWEARATVERGIGPLLRNSLEKANERLGRPWSEDRLREYGERPWGYFKKVSERRQWLADSGLGEPVAGDQLERAAARDQTRWLVEGVLLDGQPAVIGGPKKVLKTSLAVDLAISLASGEPFLGRFPVDNAFPVLMFSGESGAGTLAETARRVAAAKGLDRPPFGVTYYFGVPRLAQADAPRLLQDLIYEHQAEVVIVDPLYLALLVGNTGRKELNAANLFDTGPLLHRLAAACHEAAATLVLLHHATKGVPPGRPMELEHLAFAGIQEFARQWVLINRRRTYAKDGRHQLLLNVGGSAGHSDLWDVDVVEGKLTPGGPPRTWDVRVRPHVDAEESDGEAAEGPRTRRRASPAEKLLAALRDLQGGQDDVGVRRKAAQEKAGLSGTTMRKAVEDLVGRGLLVEESRADPTTKKVTSYLLVSGPDGGAGTGTGTAPL